MSKAASAGPVASDGSSAGVSAAGLGVAGRLTGMGGGLPLPMPTPNPIDRAPGGITVTGLPHEVHFMIFPLGGTSVSGTRCSVPHASQVALTIVGSVPLHRLCREPGGRRRGKCAADSPVDQSMSAAVRTG